MGLVSNKKAEKVAFFNDHLALWQLNATAIGTSTTAVTALGTKVTAAIAALQAQGIAEDAAKNATDAANDLIKSMGESGADIIKAIRAKAAVTGNTVYQLAGLPNPSTPTPVNTLGKPTDVVAEIGETGILTLKWKCANPRATGTVYQVWRRNSPTGQFNYLGGNGAKKFIDTTIPAGSTQLTYQIQAVRSTAQGPWTEFNVNFGMGSGGTFTASVVENIPTKLAA